MENLIATRTTEKDRTYIEKKYSLQTQKKQKVVSISKSENLYLQTKRFQIHPVW